MIKVKNSLKHGSLFHYAHFICDCLFPEIVSDIFTYNEVIREKNIKQTIGNFSKIYMEVMSVKNTELYSEDFDKLDMPTFNYKNKEEYESKFYFDKFRNYIFEKYKIKNLEYDNNYPEVILIKRGGRINLIDDEYLSKINTNVTTGIERREINNINIVEDFLQTKFKDKFKSLYFEHLPFVEQIKYFNNAKIIICAHGAVMANMFFCKENTKIYEVTCGTSWKFFDKISGILKLVHIKCTKNISDFIIKDINKKLNL